MKDFSMIVRTIRKELAMTQKELGARLGRTGNTISRWETGEIVPDEPELIRLALEGLLFEKTAREFANLEVILTYEEKL